MRTFDVVFLGGCGVMAMWILVKAFKDNRQLQKAGVAGNYRRTVLLACVGGAVEVALLGVLLWLIRTDAWGSASLRFLLLMGLGGAILGTYKVWNDAWDAGRRDWDSRGGDRD